MRGERTRRGDCAGKLYVRVLGGYLIGADDDLRAVDCCVALEEDEAEERLSGCLLVEIRFIQTRTKDRSAGAALHEAIKNGQVKLVEIIINALRRKMQVKALTWRPSTEDGMNAYELAARHGQTRVLEALLRNTSSSAWSAWTNSSPPKGLTALHMAVLGNSASSAQALLDHARKQELTTSLFDSGGFDYLQELGGSGLERHRSLASHAKNIMLKATDDEGRTPFALACGMELPRDPMLVVLSLSQLGAGIAATDNKGNTPLMAAIFAGQSAVACALLEMTEDGPPGVSISRACPNMPNKEGLRPLHIAARKGDIVVVKALLEAGALSALRSSAGSTPLHLAARHGHLEVAKALIDWPMQFAVTEEEQYLADKQRRARRRLTRNASSRSSDEDLDAEVRAQIEADASLAAAVAAMEEGSYSRFYGFLGQEEESSAASRLRARQRHEAFTAHAMVDDTGSSARFQRLRRAKTRFSRLVGRMRQRRQPVPTSPPTSSSSSLEGGIEIEASTPESSAPATDENSPREPTSGADASAGEENQALGSRERNNSDATFIATDDEEEHEDDEVPLGAGAAMSSDADHAAPEGDSDYFGGVTKIKEEKVKFKGVSRREALAHRDPGVDAVEWSTWLTPAEIAEREGHPDVYNYLRSFLEPETNGSSGEGAGNSVAKQKPEAPAVSSASKDHDGLPPTHGHVKGPQEATSTPQPRKSAVAAVAAVDDDHDDEGMDTFLGPAETEIGTDEYYEYPFMDADSA
ncbi:Ankyrin repeat domain-containing protein 50 [Hondaea fermentalgiana]|uniref:Ankyrin repeat domain-containing protein 50 n=1 Tax=Hondaea fermentalgiana TaxID=2315210 RepID=A0A2R5GQW6_9STRA|nr:Ankyrin repeat domain-containing protein 50 [Hondaea fermentalgiana]|eukprot:GBG30274.1 Ankyrin repeat domain-containing protein 50 [Hondaea fermentalgiana]